jgi:hypothetical protein
LNEDDIKATNVVFFRDQLDEDNQHLNMEESENSGRFISVPRFHHRWQNKSIFPRYELFGARPLDQLVIFTARHFNN